MEGNERKQRGNWKVKIKDTQDKEMKFFLGWRNISKRKRATSWRAFDWVLIMWILEALPCSRSSINPFMVTATEAGRLTTFLKYVLTQPINGAAVGKGDARVREEFRVQNKGNLTRGNGSVMDTLCKEDRSSTPPSFCCLLCLPALLH